MSKIHKNIRYNGTSTWKQSPISTFIGCEWWKFPFLYRIDDLEKGFEQWKCEIMEEKINFTQRFKNSRLFKKPPQSKWFLFAVMHRFFKPQILWEWTDIALCFRVYKQTDFSDYHIGIDIQILWFNLWVQCFRKTCA